MLETHFGPGSALVWSSFMTFVCCAARIAALHGDAFCADFRSPDVDYAGLPSLIGGFEGFGRSGSLRSLQWCIVIGRNQKLITRNRLVCEFFTFLNCRFTRGPGCRRGPPFPPHPENKTFRSFPNVSRSRYFPVDLRDKNAQDRFSCALL
jgi:hypothetical protein